MAGPGLHTRSDQWDYRRAVEGTAKAPAGARCSGSHVAVPPRLPADLVEDCADTVDRRTFPWLERHHREQDLGQRFAAS